MSWRDGERFTINIRAEFPCKGCQKRTAGCHGDCAEYIAAKERVDAARVGQQSSMAHEGAVKETVYSQYRKKHRREG